MVSQLLSPRRSKNVGDILLLFFLGLKILSLLVMPKSWRIPVFCVAFVLWRVAYNVGIGYLLYIQSNYRRLDAWTTKYKVFVNPRTGDNPHPLLYRILKRELETKIPSDYHFETAPLEFNTWLLFRRVCDFILMSDFVSYCLFLVANFTIDKNETIIFGALRWSIGLALVVFNYHVKMDAHRVVKDYAWYWGDFFYYIDQKLTFDGVYEMAPDPMYTIGYVGFYGFAMIAKSRNVLMVSIFAHVMQLFFLKFVESPHMDKTYGDAPSPRRRSSDDSGHSTPQLNAQAADINGGPALATTDRPSPVHKFLGLQNLDLFRLADASTLSLQFYIFVLTVSTPSSKVWQNLFLIQAVLWRLWYSIGMGFILREQSEQKLWTRHFMKYGESTEEAWRQWKGQYHLAMTMTYTSFVAAAWKVYELPFDWTPSHIFLGHVLGIALISLQIWAAASIYESLGEFGWFFGDFFYEPSRNLTYDGIYRFFNNPEGVIGLAGVWGAFLVTWHPKIFFLALLSHLLAWTFHLFVERPHMRKLYGGGLRKDSGFMKGLKRTLPPSLQRLNSNVDRMLDNTADFFGDFVDMASPKIASGVQTLVKDSTAMFKYPTRISITRLEPDLAGLDPKDYSLEVNGKVSPTGAVTSSYGSPIKVRWTAPLNHSKRDWVGLYRVADSPSRDVTRTSSHGRWIPTETGQWDSAFNEGCLSSNSLNSGRTRRDGEAQDFFSGEMEFSGDKLFWKTGVFEFRYHHNGKHNVMAISQPFEIRIEKFDEDDAKADAGGRLLEAVEQALLPLVQNCFDRDPDIAPDTVSQPFGGLVERKGKYGKRVVYAVLRMFGIEFAPEVVQADGSVKNLAWRICNAKKVLVSTLTPLNPCDLLIVATVLGPLLHVLLLSRHLYAIKGQVLSCCEHFRPPEILLIINLIIPTSLLVGWLPGATSGTKKTS